MKKQEFDNLVQTVSDASMYIDAYDTLDTMSDSQVLPYIEKQKILERLHNSCLFSIMGTGVESKETDDLKSALFFLKEAKEALKVRTQKVAISSENSITVQGVRDSVLNALLAYLKYIVISGLDRMIIETESPSNKEISIIEKIKIAFPDTPTDDINNLLEMYNEFLSDLKEIGVEDKIMKIDYNVMGTEKLSFEDIDDEDDALDDSSDSDTTIMKLEDVTKNNFGPPTEETPTNMTLKDMNKNEITSGSKKLINKELKWGVE